MADNKSNTEDYSKPVAYDQYGRPLYAHPPAQSVPPAAPSHQSASPQVVYLSRAVDPHKQPISEELKRKHEESKAKYPFLNLSDGEYVISAIKRHPIGLVSIWAVVMLAICIILAAPSIFITIGGDIFTWSQSAILSGTTIVLLMTVLAVMGGIMATVIYDSNRFYLTNESVIQHIQTGLFHKKDQTISLSNVEDASYRQHGIIQTLLNYGSVRLSTEGEETTYRFSFVSNPREQIRLLNDAVEAFKNFRPIKDKTDD